jgi:hypothetical protein
MGCCEVVRGGEGWSGCGVNESERMGCACEGWKGVRVKEENGRREGEQEGKEGLARSAVGRLQRLSDGLEGVGMLHLVHPLTDPLPRPIARIPRDGALLCELTLRIVHAVLQHASAHRTDGVCLLFLLLAARLSGGGCGGDGGLLGGHV